MESGGYHFAHKNGQWLATRDGSEFFNVLNQVLTEAADETISMTRF